MHKVYNRSLDRHFMKIYLAGRLSMESERKLLEEVESLCKSMGFETFLPHRDVGLAKGIKDVEKIFRGDILEGFKDCQAVVAVLEGLHVGAGTAWELGYAYAKKIPTVGIKIDESAEDGFDYLSPILIGSMPILTSLEDLKEWLKDRINQGA